MRILFVITGLDAGGTEHQLLILARGLKRRGHSVRVCSLGMDEGILRAKFLEAGIPVSEYPARRFLDWGALLWLRREMEVSRPEIVQTFLFQADFLGLVAATAARVPIRIASVRSSDVWKRPYHWLVSHMVGRLSSCIVSNTATGAKNAAAKARLNCKKHEVIPNAWASDLKGTFNSQKVGMSAAFNIMTVGRIDSDKNLGVLLQACSMLQTRSSPLQTGPIVLHIVGTGPEEPGLRRLAHDLGISKATRFYGYRADVPELLARADCFVLPSLCEGMSNALIEAMAPGLPVIVSDMPGNREIVTADVNGLVFDPYRADELADRIVQLMDDPPLRQRIGEAARQWVQENCAEDIFLDRHEALYCRLLARRRGDLI